MAVVIGVVGKTEAGVVSEIASGVVIEVRAGTGIGILGGRRAVSEVRIAIRVEKSLPASMTTRLALVIGLVKLGSLIYLYLSLSSAVHISRLLYYLLGY